jgi:hypothetical protein
MGLVAFGESLTGVGNRYAASQVIADPRRFGITDLTDQAKSGD